MMRLVREQVSEHGPLRRATLASNCRQRTLKRGDSERPREHPTTCAQALRGASSVRGSNLLHGAAAGIEWRRTLQMRPDSATIPVDIIDDSILRDGG